ncbi:hypothetical protein LG198_14290 [Methylobacillus arboreus]|uniref:hypothetical protein n=1 Tax=Methylobacillus arboreus TaxID=755170 RepID=UPI001E55D489|nr:hypothetical protein [Methylobacillus arboreus]MCB5191899.1 hypothetical protein [Methylobacillus arboreus]
MARLDWERRFQLVLYHYLGQGRMEQLQVVLSGGGIFLWEYEFNGGSDYVKSTYKNGILKFNGKEYVQNK